MNTSQHDLMLPTEVANLFRVNPKTVSRWARQGKLECVQTPGKHRRYYREQVMDLYQNGMPTNG
jgi:excisionase family DNA binding protein